MQLTHFLGFGKKNDSIGPFLLAGATGLRFLAGEETADVALRFDGFPSAGNIALDGDCADKELDDFLDAGVGSPSSFFTAEKKDFTEGGGVLPLSHLDFDISLNSSPVRRHAIESSREALLPHQAV